MTLYTVYGSDNGHVSTGLTVQQAAQELLTSDGYTYQIAADEKHGGFCLWISRASRNATGPRGMTQSIFFSLQTDPAAAEAEIYQAVVDHDGTWHGLEAMTDEDYERMVEESQEE